MSQRFDSEATVLSCSLERILEELGLRLDRFENNAANQGLRPSYVLARALLQEIAGREEVLDAPRGLLLYLAGQSPRMRWRLRDHLNEGRYELLGLSVEQLDHRGAFPKAEQALMVTLMTLMGLSRKRRETS